MLICYFRILIWTSRDSNTADRMLFGQLFVNLFFLKYPTYTYCEYFDGQCFVSDGMEIDRARMVTRWRC